MRFKTITTFCLSIFISLAANLACDAPEKPVSVVGSWTGASTMPGARVGSGNQHPQLLLSADHTFELTLGKKTTGTWVESPRGVKLSAKTLDGAPMPPGSFGNDIVLQLSRNHKSMMALEQPVRWTKD